MAASAATLVFLLSLICLPSRFLTGALPPPPPTVAKAVTPPPETPSKPVTPPPATPSKPVTPPPPAKPSKSASPPPATPSKPVLPPPATPPKLSRPPRKAPPPATPPKPSRPPRKAPSKPVLPPPATPTKPVPPPRAAPPMQALSTSLAPIPWDQPGYQAKPIPEPVRKACARTVFPDLCGRVLGFAVDPQRANDTRHLAEASARAAIQAGTALANFGYVYIAGAKNGTRLVMCVRDCTIRIDAAVKNMTASVAAMKKGARAEASQLAGEAAKGCGVCWGSCARFTGEAMVVMIKRARQFERLIMIAGSIILMII